MEVELRKFNRRKQKNANDYYNKCFERVKDKFDEPLSAENLEKFQLAKDSLKAINDLYDNFEETEIEYIAGEFKDITMYWDLRKFEEEKEKHIHRKWGILFRKIESNFAQIADHMEDECFNSTTDDTHEAKYPSYMLPSKYYMLPRHGPCNVKNPCEKCRKATQHDLELFEKNARYRNSKYLSNAKDYFKRGYIRVAHLFLSAEAIAEFENVQDRFEELHKHLETEIDKITIQANKLKLWKEVDMLYGKLDSLSTRGQLDNDRLIEFEWRKLLWETSKKFYQLAEHVEGEEYRFNIGTRVNTYTHDLVMPKAKSCDEKDPCKKCKNV